MTVTSSSPELVDQRDIQRRQTGDAGQGGGPGGAAEAGMGGHDDPHVVGLREQLAEPGHRVGAAAAVQEQEWPPVAVLADGDVDGTDISQGHAADGGHGVSSAKSEAGTVAYRLIAAALLSGVRGWPRGDHVPQVPEILHVQIGGERVQQHRRLVGRVGEGVRGTGRDHDERPGRRVVAPVRHGEPGGAGHDVETFVVPGVPVLRRAVGVRGEGDLADAQPVASRAPVFEDPHLHRAQLDRLPASGRDD